MRIAFGVLIGLHGIIHLFGFLKAYGIAEFDAINRPITKIFGIVWLLTFVLFVVAAFLLMVHSSRWWMFGMVGIAISQVLIINYWSDAKFGTLLNIVILAPALISFSGYNFTKKVNGEISQMLSKTVETESIIVAEEMTLDLPRTVQKWLKNSGVMGKEVVHRAHMQQELQMLMKPGQKEWTIAKARQYFTVVPPAFHWVVNLNMGPLLEMVGRDKFENGKGEMSIKIFSFFPIANARNDEKVNQATLQRYLAEMVWFPSASLNP